MRRRRIPRRWSRAVLLVLCLSLLAGWDFHVRTAQAIQQQLKPASLDVEGRVLESGALNSDTSRGNYDSVVLGASGTIDPDDRETLYRQIQERLTLQGPKAFLFMWHNDDALRPEVKGYVSNPAPSSRQRRDVWLDR